MIRYKIIPELVEPAVTELCEQLLADGATKEITLMPDTHLGIGAAIGSVFEINDKLNVHTIGNDIGCGMSGFTFKTDKVLDEEFLKAFNAHITSYIPSGFDGRNKKRRKDMHKEVNELYSFTLRPMFNGLMYTDKEQDYFLRQLGTLGGGNHFIEIGYNESEDEYILIVHSGSRGLGSAINKRFTQNKEDKYITGKELELYKKHQNLAVDFARLSRVCMARELWLFLHTKAGAKSTGQFNVIHNYLDDTIVRKGAISAYKNEDVVIPLNMVDGVILGKGVGNPEWMFTAPHGAGRSCSRRAFIKHNDLEDTRTHLARNGVVSFTMNDKTLDESPFAYKDTNIIMKDLHETVKDIKIYKSKFNFKGE